MCCISKQIVWLFHFIRFHLEKILLFSAFLEEIVCTLEYFGWKEHKLPTKLGQVLYKYWEAFFSTRKLKKSWKIINEKGSHRCGSNLIKQKFLFSAHKQHMPHYNFAFNLSVARFYQKRETKSKIHFMSHSTQSKKTFMASPINLDNLFRKFATGFCIRKCSLQIGYFRQ